MKNGRYHRIALVIILVGLVLPALMMGMFLFFTPSVSPEEAAQVMRDPDSDAILIDVRPAKEFNAFSLQESINVPLDAPSFDRQSQDKVLGGKKHILVMCDTGISGAWATRKLRGMGFLNAVNIQGGFDAWLTSDSALLQKRVRTSWGESDGVSPVTFPITEQIVITAAAFVVKPLYQILSIIILIMLWKRADPDFTALRWAVLSFFIGENACALNYLFFNERSLLMEFFHTYGMLVCFGLVVYALMEAFDNRVFHFSEEDKKCALLPQCGRCYKYNSARCNLRMLFLFGIPATAVIAAIPLTAQLGSHFFMGNVFGNPVIFGHPVMYQVLEARLYPLASLFFFTVSFIYLLMLGENGFKPAKIFSAMGMGPLGFSLLRFLFYWGYQQNPLWADAWEEITEFLFLAAIFWIMLRVRAVSRQPDSIRS
jgi:rhodanese-related sulfurtransferase